MNDPLKEKLLDAIGNSDLEQIKEIVKQGAVLNGPNSAYLSYASLSSNATIDVVKCLIDLGANVDHFSPLTMAVNNKSEEDLKKTRLLLKEGANVNTNFSDPLRTAVKNNNLDAVEVLLMAGANPFIPSGEWSLIYSQNDGLDEEEEVPYVTVDNDALTIALREEYEDEKFHKGPDAARLIAGTGLLNQADFGKHQDCDVDLNKISDYFNDIDTVKPINKLGST